MASGPLVKNAPATAPPETGGTGPGELLRLRRQEPQRQGQRHPPGVHDVKLGGRGIFQELNRGQQHQGGEQTGPGAPKFPADQVTHDHAQRGKEDRWQPHQRANNLAATQLEHPGQHPEGQGRLLVVGLAMQHQQKPVAARQQLLGDLDIAGFIRSPEVPESTGPGPQPQAECGEQEKVFPRGGFLASAIGISKEGHARILSTG